MDQQWKCFERSPSSCLHSLSFKIADTRKLHQYILSRIITAVDTNQFIHVHFMHENTTLFHQNRRWWSCSIRRDLIANATYYRHTLVRERPLHERRNVHWTRYPFRVCVSERLHGNHVHHWWVTVGMVYLTLAASSYSSYSHFYMGSMYDYNRAYTPPCSTVVHFFRRHSLLLDISLQFAQPSSLMVSYIHSLFFLFMVLLST